VKLSSRDENLIFRYCDVFAIAILAVLIATVALMPRRSHLVAWARRMAKAPSRPMASVVADRGASVVPMVVLLGVVGAALSIPSFASLDALLASTAAHVDPEASFSSVMPVAGAIVLLPAIFAAALENSSLRHSNNVIGWTLLSLAIALLLPLAIAGVVSIHAPYAAPGYMASSGQPLPADFNARHDLAAFISSLSPLSLVYFGIGREAAPFASWIASFSAVAFFVGRGQSARRALVARMAGAS
jgi:hypothetical protein